MFSNLTLTSIFWILVGVFLIIGGSFLAYSKRMSLYSILPLVLGLVSLGAGSIICGITNGFTDYSRRGRLLWKFGAVFLLIGLLLTVYGGYKYG